MWSWAVAASSGITISQRSPLGSKAANLSYALKTETNATADYWVQLVARARKRLWLAGIGFTSWRGIPGLKEALASAASSGCDIRILTMDADNPAFPSMLNPDVSAANAASQRPSLLETRSWFRNVVGTNATADVRALGRGMLFQQIIICDDQALISPYLYSRTTAYSPCLEISEKCPVFDAFMREFDALWTVNEPPGVLVQHA